MNWGWLLLRIAIGLTILSALFLSQRFWYRSLWRLSANWRVLSLRVAVRLGYVALLLLIIGSTVNGFRMGHTKHLIPSDNLIDIFAGLWFTSALFAYLAMKMVRLVERLWASLRSAARRNSAPVPKKAVSLAAPNLPSTPAASPAAAAEIVPDPSRRYFFRTASALAGAAPFLSVMYGFAAERLDYHIRRVEIPTANLPPALDGMKIAQLSDIHLSGYMSRTDVRRAVDMANELGADLAVVTGDFITGAADPLEDCIDEVRNLRAPLGVFGCNGNHEIYARAEDAAQIFFAQAGMRLLRHENVQLAFRGAQFNLLGVDYQRERTPSGHRLQMLPDLAPLVRRDMPNILLSHNPNTFNRAAELGIELSLAGHTHGGQIQVEILDHRLSPARFITDYIAGAFFRPLSMPAANLRALKDAKYLASNETLSSARAQPPLSVLYVNRGLGTVGAPVRLGVPPEITLITLRRA
ncbi:MAG TPA: metallophosphoesterase [Candidatus Acidoferrum sp.]|nr:metallophosphoesterase [Candidatus Acidoferrum sp.]